MKPDGSNLRAHEHKLPVIGHAALHLPVVENLAAHDVTADTPAIVVTLFPQPIVPEDLRVEIKRLVGRVVNVEFGACKR